MTVSSVDNKRSFAGDNSTTVFATPYFLVNNDIKATLRDDADVETLLVEGSDYTLTGAGVPTGGTLTTQGSLSPPKTNETLVIKVAPDFTQLTDYPEAGPFPAAAHENALDKLTLIAQTLQELASDRTITFPVTDEALNSILPIDTERAGKVFVFDSSGNPTVATSISLFTITFNINTAGETIIDDSYAGALIRVDPTAGDITLRFRSTSQITTQQGNFAGISVANTNNNVIITTETPGEMRSQNGTVGWSALTDPIYAGTSAGAFSATADECAILVKRLGGLWIFNGQFRSTATIDQAVLTASSIVPPIDINGRTFVDADANKQFRCIGAGAVTISSALTDGFMCLLINRSGNDVPIFGSGLTVDGDTLLGNNNFATVSKDAATSALVKATG